MREIIDAAALREMLLCANAALEENKQKINELNVFPVPDGDTGTNMSMTMNMNITIIMTMTTTTMTTRAKAKWNMTNTSGPHQPMP